MAGTQSAGVMAKFPIDIQGEWRHVDLDIKNGKLPEQQKKDLLHNIGVMRDSIIMFTATGAARGVSGHTGGPFDTAPEVSILQALFTGKSKDDYVPVVFDEAGHRVATQYFLCALNGDIPAEHLLHYRAANSKLPGHPELGLTPGVKFSSGRLGHMWPLVNGVAMANRDKVTFCLGSDGSFQEGDDAEAARLAVAQNLNIKFLCDDNNVTIAGHPSDYLKGYSMKKTLEGHGLKVLEAEGEDIDSLYGAISQAIATPGPVAVVAKRLMAPGVPGLEGSPHGHEVIAVDKAIPYLESRGVKGAADILRSIKPAPVPYLPVGSSKEYAATRSEFGEAVVKVLEKAGAAKRKNVMVIDSDLEGSTGLKAIHKAFPECFVSSGIMERGNFSAAAGFGFAPDKFGVFSTFAAFLEMIISELTMARLNHANVLCHFSHSGVDEMADNTCHFGINNFFADNGLSDVESFLYMPADGAQMHAIVEKVFFQHGCRFIFSTRSKTPYLLKEGTQDRFYGPDYVFEPGVDEVIREGTDLWIVSYGEMLYRCVDAVDRFNSVTKGSRAGLINKATLNAIDEKMLQRIGNGKVLVVESQNYKTGLGSRLGTWLLERGLTPKFKRLGTMKEGCGGITEQIPFQGLAPEDILSNLHQLNTPGN